MQAITGQFAACQYYTNYLPQHYIQDSHPHCTWCNRRTKEGLDPTTERSSSDGVQNIGAALSRVGCTAVHLNDRFHKGIRPHQILGLVVLARALWSRACLCQISAKTIQSTGRNSLHRKKATYFPIKRGTKQGDCLSCLLFNTVLQFSLESDLKRWQEKQKGIRLSDKKDSSRRR